MTNRRWLYLATGLAAFLGGVAWIWFGTQLASLPPGIPGLSYRGSFSYMPGFGAGLLCIGIGAAGVYALHAGVKRTALMRWSAGGALLGSGLYLYGTITRLGMIGVWEAMQPVGFLMTVAGLFAFGISVLQSRSMPRWCGVTILFSAVSLLTFNDQFVTAWASVPFGTAWVALSAYLLKQFVYVVRPGAQK